MVNSVIVELCFNSFDLITTKRSLAALITRETGACHCKHDASFFQLTILTIRSLLASTRRCTTLCRIRDINAWRLEKSRLDQRHILLDMRICDMLILFELPHVNIAKMPLKVHRSLHDGRARMPVISHGVNDETR